MRALTDKWNPRLWLRDWLNKPSSAELAARQAAEASAAQMLMALEREARDRADKALSTCLRSALNDPGISSPSTPR